MAVKISVCVSDGVSGGLLPVLPVIRQKRPERVTGRTCNGCYVQSSLPSRQIFVRQPDASGLVDGVIGLRLSDPVTDFTDQMALVRPRQGVDELLNEVAGFFPVVTGGDKRIEEAFVCLVQPVAGCFLLVHVVSENLLVRPILPYPHGRR